jgi:TolA-binding protein
MLDVHGAVRAVSFVVLFAAVPPLVADPAAEAYREARAQVAERRFAEAAEAFLKAAEATNAVSAAAAWFGRGEALYALGNWDGAVAAYGAVPARCPDSPLAPKALCARGYAERQAGRLEEALATFTRFEARYPGHALAPSCAAAVTNLAAVLAVRERQASAADIARELEAVNAAVRAEKFAEARAAARRFLAAHPEHPHAAELKLLVATCAFRTDDFAGAAEAYRAFLGIHPQHARAAEARARLADCLLRTGDYDGARVFFEALAADGTAQEKARATLALGDCDAAQKKWEAAERAYLSVEVLQGDDALRPVALKRLAALYDAMGDPDKARRTREAFRRRYPGG